MLDAASHARHQACSAIAPCSRATGRAAACRPPRAERAPHSALWPSRPPYRLIWAQTKLGLAESLYVRGLDTVDCKHRSSSAIQVHRRSVRVRRCLVEMLGRAGQQRCLRLARGSVFRRSACTHDQCRACRDSKHSSRSPAGGRAVKRDWDSPSMPARYARGISSPPVTPPP